jgi:AcrR family transcriptional regulator
MALHEEDSAAASPGAWQRARSSDKKKLRVLNVLGSASELFQTQAYDAITMEEIARRAGFTRPNLYRYFRTKEEIFLALVDRDLSAWIDQVEQEFLPGGAGEPARKTGRASARKTGRASARETGREVQLPVDTFVDRWCDVLFRQNRLIELLPLLSISLERNVSETTLLGFKQSLRRNTERIGAVVAAVFPDMQGERFTDFLNSNLALVSGLVPMARRSEIHERVLQREELRHFIVDFAPQFRRSLRLLVRGIAAEGRDDPAGPD